MFREGQAAAPKGRREKEQLEQFGFVGDLDSAGVSEFERARRYPNLPTLLSYSHLANFYLGVLVDAEPDLT